MAVNVELWAKYIKEYLADDNQFVDMCVNRDENVVGGAIVHLPQAGNPSQVQRNRTVFPAPITMRTDTDIVYVLDEFTTDPFRIPNRETVELSYDKTMSVLKQDTANLKDLAAYNLLYKWVQNLTATERISATGTAVPTAVGNRKKITADDIRAAANMLDNQKIPSNDRVMILTPDQYLQLVSDQTLQYAFQNVANYQKGTIPQLFGFSLMKRVDVIRLDSANTVKLPEAAGAGTDNLAAIFYQKDQVERAYGDIKLFERVNDPEYYGDLHSMLLRLGGRACRADRKGVGMIVQNP